MKNIKRLQRAIDFIEEHINDEITIADVANAVAFSQWHFQVVFHAIIGDTVKEYIRKRRLTLAAQALISSKERIIEVGFSAGFESQAAFTRAFKAQFHLSPAAVRKQGVQAIMPLCKPKITQTYIHHLTKGLTMEPLIKNLDAMIAVGLQTHFITAASPNFNGLQVIPPLWQEFNRRYHEINHLVGEEKMGVTFPKWEGQDKSDLENMLYIACAAVTAAHDVPKGMVRVDIPKGRYAIFTHKGKVDGIAHTMQYIYGSWLPKSDHQLRDAPHLERYDHRFIYNDEKSECDIAVPIA